MLGRKTLETSSFDNDLQDFMQNMMKYAPNAQNMPKHAFTPNICFRMRKYAFFRALVIRF